MWTEQEGREPPFTDPRLPAEMKKTDRQKDHPFIGELARRMGDPRDRLLYSRSAEDLIELAGAHPGLARELEQRDLPEAHPLLVERAAQLLPREVR